MAYDEGLADRIRDVLVKRSNVSEKEMFGGLAFLLGGHMLCGIIGRELMLRVGPERYEAALALPHARLMDFAGRPMKGYVYVAPAGLGEDRELARWLGLGVSFVSTLPPKKPKIAAKKPRSQTEPPAGSKPRSTTPAAKVASPKPRRSASRRPE